MDNNKAYEFLDNKYDVIIRTNLNKPIATFLVLLSLTHINFSRFRL